MTYKGYVLDAFQEAAIQAIERHHTVIVAAPTGAGKTVIAEYAIEQHLAQQKKIIYTAPIKALSNQKFRDFTADYGDRIGILTGDVSINPDAPVLIMTTEIFRNVVFDDPARLEEVGYVIFDEIHYINDIQRGTVWEESIIFAPQTLDFICLSATIPNLEEFADWMQQVRPQTTVEVVHETERPVPLEHHLYLHGYGLGSLDKLKKIAEKLARRKKQGLLSVELWRPEALAAGGEGPREDEETRQELLDLISHLTETGRLPCLYFCFSRRACEEKALANIDRDLLTADERAEILRRFDELATRYSIGQDWISRELRHLVSHGVAYHHAGLLPTLKEVVEQLFTSGLIKLLFTTETFAVGVNMPACTVVFDSLEKFDGVNFRYLATREYHQMAGRAGRRGIDTRGYVYARVDPLYCDVAEVERILTGQVEPIESQFNLSYSSILNLYDEYGEYIYEVCIQSFSNYQNAKQLRRLERQLESLEEKGQRLPAIDCFKGVPEKILEYVRLKEQWIRERDRTRAERQSLRRRWKGKRHQADRQPEWAALDREVQQWQQKMERLPCHGCERVKSCAKRYRQQRVQAREKALLIKQVEMAKGYQRAQIERRLQLLREFGYLDDKGLTTKGRVASAIYGYEIQVTELLFAGLFHRLSETEINVLMAAVTFESKRTEDYEKIQPKNLQRVLDEARRVLSRFARREQMLAIDSRLEPLDAHLTMAVQAWSEGCPFEDLREYTSSSPGDLVRALRHTVDLLRQLRRAVEGDVELQDKLLNCVYRLNRDVVDAERQLRLSAPPDEPRGREELRVHATPGSDHLLPSLTEVGNLVPGASA